MDWVEALGFVAGGLTILAVIPQVVQTIRTKSTKDLSLGSLVLFCVMTLLWLAYALLRSDIPLIATNSIGFLLWGIVLGYKLKYK